MRRGHLLLRALATGRRPPRLVAAARPAPALSADTQAFGQAITMDTGQAEAEYKRFRQHTVAAEAQLEAGAYADAIRLYEEVLRRFTPNHNFGEIYLGLGCCFVGLLQHEAALAQFSAGLQVDPASSALWLNRGLVLVVLGRRREAVAAFEEGYKLSVEGSERDMQVQFAVYCGQMEEEMKNGTAALHWYERALAVDDSYSQLWYLVGCLHADADDVPRATAALQRAIACEDPWPSAYYKLSKLVHEPTEKRRLYTLFLEAQKELSKRDDAPPSGTLGHGLL